MRVLSLVVLTASLTLAVPVDETAVYYRPNPEHRVYDLPAPSQDQKADISFDQQQEIAVKFAMEKLGLASSSQIITTDRTQDSTSGAGSFHFAPLLSGAQVANAEANVNVDRYGRVSSMGHSWADKSLPLRSGIASFSASDALISFSSKMGLRVDPSAIVESPAQESKQIELDGVDFATGLVTAETKYYRTESGVEEVFELIVPTTDNYWNAYVSKSSGKDWTIQDFWGPSDESVSLVKREQEEETEEEETEELPFPEDDDTEEMPLPGSEVHENTSGHYKYRVVAFPFSDASEGIKYVDNPADMKASPLGWHNSGEGDVPTVVGNNALTQNTQQFAKRRPEQLDYDFDYKVDDVKQRPTQYWEASTINLFYVVNYVHDFTYHFGFDEKHGNFQKENFNKGGAQNDPVIANGQDRRGTNNANFATPPDGRSGTMNMYLFNQGPAVGRDGSLDNAVVAHEYMHGVTNRMTGGRTNANCLRTSQAGGMGEGWGDMLAMVLSTKDGYDRHLKRPIGNYVLPRLKDGIRQAPYSTDLTINNLMYSTIRDNGEVHAVGTIWCTMLFEVYWNLVDKLGFVENVKDNSNTTKGNVVFTHLMLDALNLQPCSPSFINARDAFLEADKLKYGGKNKCAIWKGFAKRGLGVEASSSLRDDFTLPEDC